MPTARWVLYSKVSGEVWEVPEGIRFEGYGESSFSQRFGRAPSKFHGLVKCSGKVPARVLASGQVMDGFWEACGGEGSRGSSGRFWILDKVLKAASVQRIGIMNQSLFPTFFSRYWGYHLS